MGSKRAPSLYKRYRQTLIDSKRLADLSTVDKEVEVCKLEDSAKLSHREAKAKLRSANARMTQAMATAIEASVDDIIAEAKKEVASRLAKQAVEGNG